MMSKFGQNGPKKTPIKFSLICWLLMTPLMSDHSNTTALVYQIWAAGFAGNIN